MTQILKNPFAAALGFGLTGAVVGAILVAPFLDRQPAAVSTPEPSTPDAGRPHASPPTTRPISATSTLHLPSVQNGQKLAIVGPTLDGHVCNVADMRGKPTLVLFWASWCPFSREELSHVRDVYNRHHADGFEVVGVSVDRSVADVTGYVEQNEIPWPNIYFDRDGQRGEANPLARFYQVRSIPAAFLLDREGKVINSRARGDILETAVAELLSKETTAQPEQVVNAIPPSPSTSSIAIGQPLDLAGPTVQGGQFDLKTMRGKTVLVKFWASWCPYCRQTIPNVRDIYNRYHDQGLEVVGISVDHTAQELMDFVQQQELPWPQIYFDQEGQRGGRNPLAQKYGITTIPALFLVGRDGKVIGHLDAGAPDLSGQVAAMLGKVAATTSPPVADRIGPRISATEAVFNFGSEWAGQFIDHTFLIRNTGDATLNIIQVKSTCSCAAVLDGPKQLAPGEEGRIATRVDTSDLQGHVKKTIEVISNDPNQSTLPLSVAGQIRTVATLDPATGAVFGRVQEGAETQKIVQITNNLDTPLQIESVESDSERFQVQLSTIEPGQKYELLVTAMPPYRHGPNVGKIRLKTNAKQQSEIRVRALAYFQAVRIQPERGAVFSRLRQGVPQQKTVQIINQRETPLEIEAVESSSDRFRAELSTIEPGRKYELLVTAVPPFDNRSMTGSIQLKTNTKETIFIRTTGFFQAVQIQPSRGAVFGQIQQGVRQQRVVQIINQQDTPLEIESIQRSSQRFEAKLSAIEPGRRYELLVTSVPPYRHGPNVGTFRLKTNLKPNPYLLIRASATFKSVELHPPRGANFGQLEQGVRQQKSVEIINQLETPLEIEAAESSSERFQAELSTIQRGQKYKLLITAVPPFQEGRNVGIIRLKTKSRDHGDITLQAEGTLHSQHSN